jgi:hypothetical protein
MREIKFRAWDEDKYRWCERGEILLTLDGDWRDWLFLPLFSTAEERFSLRLKGNVLVFNYRQGMLSFNCLAMPIFCNVEQKLSAVLRLGFVRPTQTFTD